MHGDVKSDNFVLKQSDYITYEQKFPIITTFIKSLLIDHTFLFVGYSLNDYNLHLIMGWINYFIKEKNVTHTSEHFIFNTDEILIYEKKLLEDRNINVINIKEELLKDNNVILDKDDELREKSYIHFYQ